MPLLIARARYAACCYKEVSGSKNSLKCAQRSVSTRLKFTRPTCQINFFPRRTMKRAFRVYHQKRTVRLFTPFFYAIPLILFLFYFIFFSERLSIRVFCIMWIPAYILYTEFFHFNLLHIKIQSLLSRYLSLFVFGNIKIILDWQNTDFVRQTIA